MVPLLIVTILCPDNARHQREPILLAISYMTLLNALILAFCKHDKLRFNPNCVHIATNKIIYVFSDCQFEMTVLIESLNSICLAEARFKYCFCF